ncbi:MAG: hypothetical protein ACYTEQ_12965 [Planctomycetota bacterium]|jgi:hypothetical protein
MRRGELITNVGFLSGLAPAGIVLVCSLATSLFARAPTHYILSVVVLWAVGFSMFLKAKLSVIRQGILCSFGPKGMSRGNRVLYVSGYVVMGISLFLSMLLLAFCRVQT